MPSISNSTSGILERLKTVSARQINTHRAMSEGIKPESQTPPNHVAQAQFLKGQISAYTQSNLNCVEARSFCQEASLKIKTGINLLQECLSLSVGENNVTHSSDMMALTDKTFQSTLEAFEDLLQSVTWNKKTVFDGTFSPQFQIGITADDTLTIVSPDLSLSNLNISGIDITTQPNAKFATDQLQEAINTLIVEFSNFTSHEETIKYKINAVEQTVNSMKTIRSDAMDTDIPEALMESAIEEAEKDVNMSLLTADQEDVRKKTKLFENLR